MFLDWALDDRYVLGGATGLGSVGYRLMEIVTMFVCVISMTAQWLPEYCAKQDILIESEDRMADYCELKQIMLDREFKAGNPYEPVMTECRLYVPEQDEERLAPLEFEDEHD